MWRGPQRGAMRHASVCAGLSATHMELIVLQQDVLGPVSAPHATGNETATASFSTALRLELRPLRVVWDRAGTTSRSWWDAKRVARRSADKFTAGSSSTSVINETQN
jgi:hypothetical protein